MKAQGRIDLDFAESLIADNRTIANNFIAEEELKLKLLHAGGDREVTIRVQRIKRLGFDVYAWRWPAVVKPDNDPGHHYALNEAAFVGKLIDQGLDGYIADPEADRGRETDNWNKAKWAPLATQFCDAIKISGRKKNKKFSVWHDIGLQVSNPI
jgi:hypothetical protein